MTRQASAIILGGDESLEAWLRDRFGIDTTKALTTNGLVLNVSHNEALTMTVKFFVGADDLAAFPQAELVAE